MAQAGDKPEWGAVRVRQTFIDYFKERGHDFGTSSIALLLYLSQLGVPPKNAN